MKLFTIPVGDYSAINAIARQELTDAGIEPFDTIVPTAPGHTSIIGQLGPWSFRRDDTCWIAEGPGMPLDRAEILNAQFKEVVRVAGVPGGTDPCKHFRGFAVPVYHVDTDVGLHELAMTIKAVMRHCDEN